MPQQWFVRRGDAEDGPLTTQDLKLAVAMGDVSADDLVRTAASTKWHRAGDVKGLVKEQERAANSIPVRTVAQAQSHALPPPPTSLAALKTRRPKFTLFAAATIIVIGLLVVVLMPGRSPNSETSPIKEGIGKPSEQRGQVAGRKAELQQNPTQRPMTHEEKRKLAFAEWDAKDQARLQKLVDRLFGSISLDPVKCITLSKSLREGGASVELRGKNYPALQRLHENRDWLGFINYLLKDTNAPAKSLPDEHLIRKSKDLMNSQLFMLLKTDREYAGPYDQGPTLVVISFAVSPDRQRYAGEGYDRTKDRNPVGSSQIGAVANFEKHPDGIGYIARWSPSCGLSVVGVVDRKAVRGLLARQSETLTNLDRTLKKKFDLGEIDEEGYEAKMTQEIVRMFDESLKWAEEH
jgi:hypothetical protein